MTAIAPTLLSPAPVPFLRLIHVESRKLVDTRAGRGLMLAIGLATAAAVVLTTVMTPRSELSWSVLAFTSATPQALLLPVMGILVATAEWSHRTGLTTCTLEPRRVRIGLAKCVAAMLAIVVAVVAALVLGAIANVVGIVALGSTGSWHLPLAQLFGGALMLLIGVVQGVAFGLAIGRSAPAIVAILLLPNAWSLVGALMPALEQVAPWLDLSSASGPLLVGTLTGQDWLQLATSTAAWVALPLVVGLLRLRHHEFK